MIIKRTLALALALLVLPSARAPAQTPPLSPEDLRKQVEGLSDAIATLLHALPPAVPLKLGVTVATSNELQAALNKGGLIELVSALTYEAPTFTVSVSGTTLLGNGASLRGTSGPALRIMPGVHKVAVGALTATADYGSVIQCGDNSIASQGTYALQPKDITFADVRVPTHRGKRAFEINCAAVISNPTVLDVYSSEGQDSQAIAVINSCGPVSVIGGTLVAGSENFIIGGDRLQIADCPEGVAADVVLDGVLLYKPIEWRVGNVRVAPKNVVEIKAGKRVTVRNSIIRHSYAAIAGGGATQDGSCIVITPKNAQFIDTVLFENNVIDQCGGGVQLMGKDYNSVTPFATKGIVFRGNRWTIDGPTHRGRGVLALVVGGATDVLFDHETVIHTSASLFTGDSATPMGPFTITNSRMTTGRLVCSMPGVNYCGPAPVAYAGRTFTLLAEGNTFADAPLAFKLLYPKNTFVVRAAFDALLTAK